MTDGERILGLGDFGANGTGIPVGKLFDDMFLVAARTLAASVSDEHLEAGMLYPPLRHACEISVSIAAAVAESGRAAGVSQGALPGDLARAIRSTMYDPYY